jgi:hypothetical protein
MKESSAGEVPSIVHHVLRSPGQPLDLATRSVFEPRFGHDFSKVRVHADAKAAESARAVNALAYTVGTDVVFDPGRYSPASGAGQRLLAHELAHVVQQDGTGTPWGTPGILRMGDPRDPLEYEADALATVLSRQAADQHSESKMQSTPVEGPVLRKEDDPAVGGEEEGEGKETKAAGGETAEAGGAQAAAPPCIPQGLSRADYLKQSGTSTDDFGLTTLKGDVGVPTVHTSRTTKGRKAVTLDLTDARFPPLTSVYTKEGIFTEGEGHVLDSGECPSGKYPLKWWIYPGGARKIREAELEHCQDFKYAFDISLRRYADVVNNLSKKNIVFASQEEAENYVTKIVGPAPGEWEGVFECLLKKSKQARDGTKANPGPHVPRPQDWPPRLRDDCKFAYKIITEQSLKQVGKVPSQDIINVKDCPEGPAAKAKRAARPAREKTMPMPLPEVQGEVEKGLTAARGPEGSVLLGVGGAHRPIAQRPFVPALAGSSQPLSCLEIFQPRPTSLELTRALFYGRKGVPASPSGTELVTQQQTWFFSK